MKNRTSAILMLAVLLVVVVMAFYLNQPTAPPQQSRHVPVVAIATLMSHPALDALQKGIKDELAAEGYVDGKTISFVERNANGQIQLTATIASELASRNPDVIVPITTPMAQAVVKAARGNIVFASVTSPVTAGVVKTLDGEPRITGASDAWPYEAQLKLIQAITPSAKRIGVLFNPGEAASQHGMVEIRAIAASLGFIVVEGPVNSTNEINAVARGLADRVDALYLSSDNTVISGMNGALSVALQRRLPLYVGDSGSVEKGGLATVSVGYYEHGRHTGQLVVRTLRGETNIPIIVEKGTEVSVNLKAAEQMGIRVPDAVLEQATNIYRTLP